jgi:hypothetical protein
MRNGFRLNKSLPAKAAQYQPSRPIMQKEVAIRPAGPYVLVKTVHFLVDKLKKRLKNHLTYKNRSEV